MSYVDRLKWERARPLPLGINFRGFVSYWWPQMKELALTPTDLTLAPGTQTILSVYIPANSFAEGRALVIRGDYKIQWTTPPFPAGGTVQEQWRFNGSATGGTFGPAQAPTVPGTTETHFERVLFRSNNGLRLSSPQDAPTGGYLSSMPNTQFNPHIEPATGIPDFTIDQQLDVELVVVPIIANGVWTWNDAQAFIQSPYQLGRIKGT